MDVVKYINKLAQKRNELESEKNMAVYEAGALAGEVEKLQRELEEAKMLMQKSNEKQTGVIESAVEFFEDFEDAFRTLNGDLEKTSAHVHEVLMDASSEIAKLPTLIMLARERLETLRLDLNAETGVEMIEIGDVEYPI